VCGDSVLKPGWHVHETPRADLADIFSERQLDLAADEVEGRGHGGGMRLKLLPGRETEDHDLEMLVIVKGAAEDAVFRDLHLGFQIGIEGVAHQTSVRPRNRRRSGAYNRSPSTRISPQALRH